MLRVSGLGERRLNAAGQITAEFAIDAGQQVQIESRGDSQAVVVRVEHLWNRR